MSSATNTIPNASETSSQGISTPARRNPIAAEIPVNASGSRPKGSSTERELFSEDTETVLTFEDGAVIRLLAPVTPGQLIFLTNLVTKQEVVCEVLGKRLLRPAGCYVELQFTEKKKGFWDGPERVAAQTAAELLAGRPKKETGDPSKKSLETLVAEVQELLARKAAPENKEPPAGVEPTEGPEQDAQGAPLAGANRAAVEAAPVDQEEGKAARVESDDPSDDLLPKPELDFSQVPSAPAMKKHDRSLLQKPIPVVGATTQKLTWALLLLALLGVGARYGHWLDSLMQSKVAAETAAEPAGSAAAHPAQAGLKDGAAKNGEATATSNGTAAIAAPALSGAAEKSQVVAERAGSGNAEPTDRTNEPAPAKEQSGAQASADRRGKSEASAMVRAEVSSKDAEPAGLEPLVPAKLLKSVNPVYPPDAMRNFVTGDVKAEVEVEKTGHAGGVKVLSGPAPLKKAALDAVKQYEFSPATQGGKAVPSKVIVTVKFWFNP